MGNTLTGELSCTWTGLVVRDDFMVECYNSVAEVYLQLRINVQTQLKFCL